MFRHYYINKEWIVSNAARRIYRVAAGFSLLLFALMVIVTFNGGVRESFAPATRLLFRLGILGRPSRWLRWSISCSALMSHPR